MHIPSHLAMEVLGRDDIYTIDIDKHHIQMRDIFLRELVGQHSVFLPYSSLKTMGLGGVGKFSSSCAFVWGGSEYPP